MGDLIGILTAVRFEYDMGLRGVWAEPVRSTRATTRRPKSRRGNPEARREERT